MPAWTLATHANELRRRFLAAWRTLPQHNRRRWFGIITGGALAMFGLMAVLILLARLAYAHRILYWEPDFLHTLELRGPFGFSSAVWFQTFGTDITLAILVLFTFSLSAWSGRPLTALNIVLAVVVVDLAARFSWLLWARPRPDLIAQGMAAPGFHSFPSGHTGKTIALYGLLASVWWRASRNITERVFILVLVAFVITIVPLARLRMGVHWPSDIMGGYVIGIAWLSVLLWAGTQESALSNERPTTGDEKLHTAGPRSLDPSFHARVD